jgi:acetoacetyl-CoA synthase
VIVNADAAEGDIIWQPDSDRSPARIEQFAAFARARGAELSEGYAALWRWSVDRPEEFWPTFVEFMGVRLGGDPGPVHDGAPMPDTRWFPGRTLNYARHLLEDREGTAILGVAEDGAIEEISFDALRGQVAALAAHLRECGVQPGDRVAAVLPNVPAAVVGLLATASVGAVWSVCSPEFGPGAITSRFGQLEPKVLIAAPGCRLSGCDRDRTAEIAQVLGQLPSVEEVVWVTAHSPSVAPPDIATPSVRWEDILATADAMEPEYVDVDFSHPLWVLFSSGTTGVPKGIVHGHGGALLEILKMLAFGGDMGQGDRYLSVASTSWVVWNSLASAIGVGAVSVLLDGNPTHPSADHVWEVAAATKATVLSVGGGFLHACAKSDLMPSRDHDLSALREIQVTGSPLSAAGFRWVYRAVGDVWLASMSGGTDIAGCFVGGVPTEPVRVGYIQAPALGVRVESWDDAGHPTGDQGELVVTAPMPSMPLFFWRDADGSRYRSSYFETFPGVWRHGDFMQISDRGIQILGRSDSTLNRNGIRLGSADIYAVVEALPQIEEALVVGAELGAEDYYMPLFVKLAAGVGEQEAKDAVTAAIREHLSVRYLPDDLIPMRAIPHTRTGKKLEVPVKRLIQGAAVTDVVDPGAVDDAALLGEYAEVVRAAARGRA